MRLERPLWLACVVAFAAGCSRAAAPVSAPPPAPPPLPSPTVAPPKAVVQPPLAPLRVTPLNVAALAFAVFGDSAPTAVRVEEVNGPTYDIDVASYETHERVEYYVALFTGTARDRIAERLEQGTRFAPMVRPKLAAAGMPEDLFYLAMIESGFNPDAYSSAAAVGLWQFMTATAKSVGLRVDWWVDERREPARATDAAIKHLKSLRKQFDGSLYLAAAAYNGGAGRVGRELTRNASKLDGAEGDDAFFALADKEILRAETRNYVPQLIAVTVIAKNAAKYGMRIQELPPYEYDSVRVGPSIPIAAVARASDAPVKELVALNPHILRGVTPPKDSLFVHVPVGSAAAAADGLRNMSAEARTAYVRVPSRAEETFAAVAKRVGLTSKQLAWYNPRDGARRGKLAAGTTILVPSADVVLAARDVPDPAVERYGSRVRVSGSRVVHRVASGETLSGIAKRYGITVTALKSRNGLRSDAIRAGQTLVVR